MLQLNPGQPTGIPEFPPKSSVCALVEIGGQPYKTGSLQKTLIWRVAQRWSIIVPFISQNAFQARNFQKQAQQGEP